MSPPNAGKRKRARKRVRKNIDERIFRKKYFLVGIRKDTQTDIEK